MKSEERVNARLDKKSSQELKKIVKATEKPVSEVIRQAIHIFYNQLFEDRPPSLALLEKSGFVGCGDGPSDLSANYKKYLMEGLEKKHGNR